MMTGFAGRRALFVNTSLKNATCDGQIDLSFGVSAEILEENGFEMEHLHLLDHPVPHWVDPNLTGHRGETLAGGPMAAMRCPEPAP